MSNVVIVPEKNEGYSPLRVIEEALKSESVDEVCIVDGWSTDGTFELLENKVPELIRKYGKSVNLYRSKLRGAGKGMAMITGMEIAVEKGHSKIAFVDADIASITSKWFDLMINGMEKYNADMIRGYFDRSPFNAQITRHITVPSINMFFPEGRGVNQPLGGELCMSRSFVQRLLSYPLAPPSTWGIDTFITVTALVERFNIVEVYLSQKLHKGKTLSQLQRMFIECFDEMANLIHFHERDKRIPVFSGSVVKTVPPSESQIERIGEDVRRLTYMNLDLEINSLFQSVKAFKINLGLLRELDLSNEDCKMISRLLSSPDTFKNESKHLNAEKWIQILHRLLLGYIKCQFSTKYHNLLFTVWRLRALAFCLNEASSFEEAERNTKLQAEYAYRFGQELAK